MTIYSDTYKIASVEELQFLRHNMPRGMISMICYRTGHPRWKVLYELERFPPQQNEEIIRAAREILFVVTGIDFETELKKRTKK